MSFTYTNVEYTDVFYEHGTCLGNSGEAAREYQRLYPNRRHPHPQIFPRIFQHLRDFGTFLGLPPPQRVPRVHHGTRDVLRAVLHSPNISVRRLSARLGRSSSRVWKTLRREGYHPYHLELVQHLLDGDYVPRLHFSNWLAGHPQLCRYILFTDEAIFTRSGIHNQHN